MKLALGTAQFGLDYGVANASGQVSGDEARAILDAARGAGIDTLDTAIAYGDSEARLGAQGVRGWRVVTKLPPLPADCADPERWAQDAVTASLGRLGVDRLHGLMLHRPADLLGPSGGALYRALLRCRADGLTERIGVSVYAPSDLDRVSRAFDVTIVQAPFNVFDRRLAESGWLRRLKEAGVEVHVRSAFLQGLLLMDPGTRPSRFDRWSEAWTRWAGWLEEAGITALEGSLGHVLAFGEVDRVVVGVDTERQLKEILRAAERPPQEAPPSLAVADPDLIDPSRWPS